MHTQTHIQREVTEAVEIAAANLFHPGDDRINIASACLRLEAEYHSEEERQEALKKLGELAYASSHIRFSVRLICFCVCVCVCVC